MQNKGITLNTERVSRIPTEHVFTKTSKCRDRIVETKQFKLLDLLIQLNKTAVKRVSLEHKFSDQTPNM